MVILIHQCKLKSFTVADARSLATSHNCKYVEVSAALDQNVNILLVGIVRQIRLQELGGLSKAAGYKR